MVKRGQPTVRANLLSIYILLQACFHLKTGFSIVNKRFNFFLSSNKL
jgi:hypothetical protein